MDQEYKFSESEADVHETDACDLTCFDEQRSKRVFSRLGFGFALFSLISMAVALIIQAVVVMVYPELYRNTLFLNLLSPVSLYLFALPVLLLVVGNLRASKPEGQKMKLSKWILILIISFGLMYIGSYIGNFLMFIMSALTGYDYSNALNSLVDQDNIWITAIFTVIVAPIGEELVFRKLIIDRTHKYGAFASVFLSGLMFGLMHGNLYQFFYAFALGLVLGYVYYSTGKLYLTIAIHAVINFVGSVVASRLMQSVEELVSTLEGAADPESMFMALASDAWGMLMMLIFVSFVFAAMVCAVVLPIALRKSITLRKGEEEIPRGRVGRVVFLNVGIIVMLIVYVLEFVLNLLPL